MDPDPSQSIEVTIEAAAWREIVTDVEAFCRKVAAVPLDQLPKEMRRRAELSIVLADDRMVQELNARYRGMNRPTNVLSFPVMTGPAMASEETLAGDGPLLLGDVVIALETTLAEARQEDLPVADHLAHLVVHGVLHLLGHDHEHDDDAASMERLETDLLGRLGIADPYAGSEPVLAGAG